jgi:hypothetical protein
MLIGGWRWNYVGYLNNANVFQSTILYKGLYDPPESLRK